MKTLFLTLRTFSATGGIEKVCRIMGKALYEESIEKDELLQVCSMYDTQEDSFNNIYFPAENFIGYGINRLKFIYDMVRRGSAFDRIILSHINLLPIGWFIKKMFPKTRIILMAHGIEIWYPFKKRKRRMLHRCDIILAVSSYTRNRVIEVHGFPKENCIILNNCLDPFLRRSFHSKKDKNLLEKYNLKENDLILLTLTRLSSKERYKGYDKVIEALSYLKEKYPEIKYLIAGRYDRDEKAYVDRLIKKLELKSVVVTPGFIPDDELEAHFAMSDLYVMPSRKEGFGIVFIEAMYYGLPVIAGNVDGSSDALLFGELGKLVNPMDLGEIAESIINIIENKQAFTPSQELLNEHFGYEAYKRKLAFAIN